MLDRPDLEDDRSEGEAVGECECCSGDIMPFENYYDLDKVLLHEDCALEYFSQFKKYI